jgi:LPS-assembly protein
MKSRFSRPACWSVLLFCLACDARAETPSPDSKSKYERVAPPRGGKNANGNKPAIIDNEPIPGAHEYETEVQGETGLRGTTSATSPQERQATPAESERLTPQQNYTSPAVKSAPSAGISADDTVHKESPPLAAQSEKVEEHALQEGEANLRTTTRPRTGVAAAPQEAGGPHAPGEQPAVEQYAVTKTDQIVARFEQESDFKLRLNGRTEPEAAPPAETAPEIGPSKTKPVFVAAERLQGHPGKDIEAIGKAELASG